MAPSKRELSDAERKRRNRKIALIAGMVLALVCKSLPPHYHAVCNAIASLCSGGHL